MVRGLAALICLGFVATSLRADPPDFPNGFPGGIVFVKQGDRTFLSVGGGILPMWVRLRDRGPDGVNEARLRFPSQLHSPTSAPFPSIDQYYLTVQLPPSGGQLELNGTLLPGSSSLRRFQAPADNPNASTVRLRATYQVDGTTRTEERVVNMQPGQPTTIVFESPPRR
jgi:hypothetical protein